MTLVKFKNRCHVPSTGYYGNDWDHLFNQMRSVWDDSSTLLSRPNANIVEREKSFEIELSVPGYQKDQIAIAVENNVLTVSHKEVEESKVEGVKYLNREFTQGGFTRSFRLSRLVDSENIMATFENGLLTIEIPKKEEAIAKPSREIPIK